MLAWKRSKSHERESPSQDKGPATRTPPWTVVWTGWVGAFMALVQACRGVLWFGLQETWREVPLRVAPWLLATFSLLWVGVFAIWVWGWWRGRPWAWRCFPGVVLAYSAYQWFDRLVLSASPLVHHDAPFVLGRTVVLLGLTFIIWHHPLTRRYFGRRISHE